jgi:hypothetical protein
LRSESASIDPVAKPAGPVRPAPAGSSAVASSAVTIYIESAAGAGEPRQDGRRTAATRVRHEQRVLPVEAPRASSRAHVVVACRRARSGTRSAPPRHSRRFQSRSSLTTTRNSMCPSAGVGWRSGWRLSPIPKPQNNICAVNCICRAGLTLVTFPNSPESLFDIGLFQRTMLNGLLKSAPSFSFTRS